MRALETLRILVIAPARHAVRQPHAGGLEAAVWDRVRWLRGRGHEVTLAAAAGSDFLGPSSAFTLPSPAWDDPASLSDTAYPDGYPLVLERAMDRLLRVVGSPSRPFDVVDNHSLDPAPILWSRDAGVPVVTTLHTPPLPGMVAAGRAVHDAPHRFVAVSGHTARAWSAEGIDAFVFPNGVDTDRWSRGRGGASWVWFGRIVPEKAPHLAMDAARRAGAHIVLAGRVGDVAYFDREIAPRLGGGAQYVGPLRQPELCALVGGSAVALVTPVWEEPFGLVGAEALSTGTPVVAFAEGGVPEVLHGLPGTAVVPPGDVDALALAASELALLGTDPPSRRQVRRAAVRRHALSRRHRDVERVLAFTAKAPVPQTAAESAPALAALDLRATGL